MGGHLLALIWLTSTLHCLHVLLRCSILGGMASTMANTQYVRSSPASRGGYVPYDYGGFLRTAPPNDFSYYHHGHGGPTAHHGGHPSAQLLLSVHGGHHAPSWDVSLVVYSGAPFPQGHGGYPRAATSVFLSLAFAGSSHHPSLPQDNHCSSSGSNITMSFPSPG